MRGAATAVENALREFVGRMTYGPRASVAGDLTESFVRRLCVLCEMSLMTREQCMALTLRYLIGLTDYEAARTMGLHDVGQYRDLLGLALTRIEAALDPTELQVLMQEERSVPQRSDMIEETRELLAIGLAGNPDVMQALCDRDQECVSMVMQVLGDLEPRHQRYLRLYVGEQIPLVDIGAAVGKNRHAVGAEISKALQQIAKRVFSNS